jgi:hypothetical protein
VVFPWETLITGAVGLAGIGGTLWQGTRSREAASKDLKASLDATAENLNLSINAENERARLAEKQRVYARCLAAFAGLIDPIAKNHAFGSETEDVLAASLATEYGTALATQQNAVSELLLIAPVDVRQLALKASTKLMHDDGSEVAGAEFRAVRDRLIQAMRADLNNTG